MKMRKFYHNKIWRSKRIELAQDLGAIVHTVPLAHAEMAEELGIKLIEEAQDVYSAENAEEMMSEIVDILEAIDCILNFHGIEKEQVLRLKELKLKELGSYTDPRLIDYVEYPDGSAQAQHCLAHPEKFPELTDDNQPIDFTNSCCK